jgi:two-component system nitrogen regulation sensor histidine kinase NtrY
MPPEPRPKDSGLPGASTAAERRVFELPPAERRRRRRELVMSIVVIALLVLLARLIPLEPLSGLLQGVGEGGLFLFLNAVTVILIVVFGMLVTRNFWKLVLERRRGALGSRLTLKFVAAFVLIAFVTTTGLFLVSALFITQSIDRWFSVQVGRALEQSGEIASNTYASAAASALGFGRRIAETIAEGRLLEPARRAELVEHVQSKQRDYNLGVVEVFSAAGEELVSAVNPEVPVASFSRQESDLVRDALAGESRWDVQEGGGGDVIRGAVPIAAAGSAGPAAGVVVVNAFVPFTLARSVESVRSTLAEYRALEPTAGHVRTAYLLELLLAAVVMLMLALWLSVRLAKGVTGPIRALAEGTAEVARGNLDVEVEADTDDEVGLLVGSFNRMTRDLREARAHLEQSTAEVEQRRRYMEVVLGTIGAGVVSIDAETRISTMNPSAQRYLGVPAGTGVVGAKLADAVRRPEILDVIENLSKELRPGLRESSRRQVQVPVEAELGILLVTATLLHDDAGGPLGTVIVLDDYTQIVKVQRMAAWREVARRIAHEIKNPLTPIQLSAQRIRRRFRDPLSRDPTEVKVFDECVDAITSQVESLKLLVDEFSNFARLPTADPKPGDLNRLVADAVASYTETEDVVFETDLDENLPTVDIDREQIGRVLTNLIDNAIVAVRPAAGGQAGRVKLRSWHDASLQSVRLEVSDDGIGIPVADRRRIFEPYFSTKRRGTGLGLAIVSRIVADHHGYIRVQDNEPRGTRFVVELPVRGL